TGNAVDPTDTGAETMILAIRSQSLSNRSEEKIRPSLQDSEYPPHNHEARIVTGLDPPPIGEGFGPGNLVVVNTTAPTKVTPIGIEWVHWTSGAHPLNAHRPHGDIDIWLQEDFIRLAQKQSVAVQDHKDFMRVHSFDVRGGGDAVG